MRQVTGWFLKGINFDEAPSSLAELESASCRTDLHKHELLQAAKWEPLLQGLRHEALPGWVALQTLAKFRRGIATGANGFFLLSQQRLLELGISPDRALACVGRAADVDGLIYSQAEFDADAKAGGKLFLLNLVDPLTEAERCYVTLGEEEGLPSRFLLANRRPWYSMEKRPVAPIWAAVFGRGDLKFVYNAASVRSLTNFHCIYPTSTDPIFCKALTLCLNTDFVRDASKLHGRVYGGGLNKFEPNDLKEIQVPDLRRVDALTILSMAQALDALNAAPDDLEAKKRANELCASASAIAAKA